MNENEMLTAILTKIAATLEEHRKSFEILSQEVSEIKKRLVSLEATDSHSSTDTKFIADMTARLKAISEALEARP